MSEEATMAWIDALPPMEEAPPTAEATVRAIGVMLGIALGIDYRDLTGTGMEPRTAAFVLAATAVAKLEHWTPMQRFCADASDLEAIAVATFEDGHG